MIRVRVRVRVKLGVGLGLGFRSGQSQCVPLFRSVNYHILVKSGTRRSRSVPPFRSVPFRKLYQPVTTVPCAFVRRWSTVPVTVTAACTTGDTAEFRRPRRR